MRNAPGVASATQTEPGEPVAVVVAGFERDPKPGAISAPAQIDDDSRSAIRDDFVINDM
jgi:hypothetical protein